MHGNQYREFFSTYSKDVRLPHQLQRAMAAEAEASREARAKVSIYQNTVMIYTPNIRLSFGSN